MMFSPSISSTTLRIVAAVHGPARLVVGDDEVDAVVLVGGQLFHRDIDRVPGRIGPQQIAAQQAARLGRCRHEQLRPIRSADEQAVLIDAQPGSARLGIDARQHPRLAGLNRRDERWAVVGFFPVGGDQNRGLGNALILNCQEAHKSKTFNGLEAIAASALRGRMPPSGFHQCIALPARGTPSIRGVMGNYSQTPHC